MNAAKTESPAQEAYRLAHLGNERRWREIKRLVVEWTECDCLGSCPNCIGKIDDIEQIADQALAGIDGPRG